MRTTQLALVGILVVLGVACSTTRLALEPIESRREVPLSYRTGWEACALEAGSAATGSPASAADARVHVTFVHLSAAECETLLGPIGGRLAALEVSPADLVELLETVRAQRGERLEDCGAVDVRADRPGEVRIASQLGYIAAFELEQRPDAAIADPVIQVVEEGCLLRLRRGAGAEEFSVEFVASTLERPVREHRISLPGSTATVTVEAPAFATQRVETSATLSSEQAFLLAGIPGAGAGEIVLVALRRE